MPTSAHSEPEPMIEPLHVIIDPIERETPWLPPEERFNEYFWHEADALLAWILIQLARRHVLGKTPQQALITIEAWRQASAPLSYKWDSELQCYTRQDPQRQVHEMRLALQSRQPFRGRANKRRPLQKPGDRGIDGL